MLVTRPGRLWQIVLRQERLLRARDRETAMAFGPDGTVLLEKMGDPASVRFEDDEVERIRGAAVFTHNHPGDRSFSEIDVAMACALEWGELRAVGPTWTHVLRPGAAGWNDQYWISGLREECLRSQMYLWDELREAIGRGRVSREEAEMDFWHLVWDRVAAHVGLEYDRYRKDQTDADRA